jgi:hypothetical protein
LILAHMYSIHSDLSFNPGVTAGHAFLADKYNLIET